MLKGPGSAVHRHSAWKTRVNALIALHRVRDTRGEIHATYQAAIPRRPCRQPVASGCAEGGAGETCQGRDHRRAAQGDRGPRDREGHQEAGGGRAQARDRRRVPPRLVAVRFLQGPRRRRALFDRRGHQVRRRRDQGGERARRRQDRFLDPSAHRAFPLRQGPHQGHAEDDHPGALDLPLPPGPPVDQQGGLPGPRRLLPRCRAGLSQGHPRLLRRRLPLPAARRHRLVDDLRPEGAGGLAQARRQSGRAAGEVLCA